MINVSRLKATTSRWAGNVTRLGRDQRGNVLMIFGFSIIPLTLAAGMGIDYARAARLQTRLNAAADAAVLAAVAQPMMSKTDDQAKTAAINMFNSQVSGLGGLVYDPANLSVVVTPQDPGVATKTRTVTVTYTARSTNIFSGILNSVSLPIAGKSQSNATVAPNIDFYVLLDTSPSMALPTTTSGLQNMRTLTGCAFACHTANPDSEGIAIKDDNTYKIVKDYSQTKVVIIGGKLQTITVINDDGDYVDSNKRVHNANGNMVDSYWLALNKGWPVRIDSARVAVKDLMQVAADTATSNKTKYRGALSTFDYGPRFKALATITDDLPSVATQADNAALWQMYSNGMHTQTLNTDDKETDFQTAFNKMSAAIPNPGSGTNTAGDKPQAIMFMVTDGMSDEDLGGRTHRELRSQHIAQCAALKARGIRIAILYTEYLPDSLTGDSWSQSNVAPYLPLVAPALQSCASPGLFYTVTTDQDISAALTALFRQAIATPRLMQ